MTVNNADTRFQMEADASTPPGSPLGEAENAGIERPETGDDSSRDMAPRNRPIDSKKLVSVNTGIRFDDVVSGQFDADEESPEIVPAKRVLAPMAETPKLHKVLAQAGM